MGLILDTCVLIDSEPKRRSVLHTVELVFERTAELHLAISAVTLVELSYGVARSSEASTRQRRQRFMADVRSQIPVVPLTEEIAVQAGLVDGS